MSGDWDSELAWLEDMSKDKLILHLIEMDGKHEVNHLATLIEEVKETRDQQANFKRYADHHLVQYNETNDEKHLEAIEQYAELSESYTEYRAMLMSDIKEVRERVRWLRQQYKKTREQQNS
jgi:hypothetical protein